MTFFFFSQLICFMLMCYIAIEDTFYCFVDSFILCVFFIFSYGVVGLKPMIFALIITFFLRGNHYVGEADLILFPILYSYSDNYLLFLSFLIFFTIMFFRPGKLHFPFIFPLFLSSLYAKELSFFFKTALF